MHLLTPKEDGKGGGMLHREGSTFPLQWCWCGHWGGEGPWRGFSEEKEHPCDSGGAREKVEHRYYHKHCWKLSNASSSVSNESRTSHTNHLELPRGIE